MAKKDYLKFDVVAKGLTGGIFFGGYTFLAVLIEYAGFAGLWFSPRVLGIISSILPGINVSFAGAFIGLVEGFITGFIACSLIALLYNKMIGKLRK